LAAPALRFPPGLRSISNSTFTAFWSTLQSGAGKTGASYCADGAIIIDDFAPHVWQASGACASWYKDYEAFAAKAQIAAASVALGKARHLDVDSGYAYLVAPTTLSYTKDSKPVTDKAIV
jgi:hypothetical protein